MLQVLTAHPASAYGWTGYLLIAKTTHSRAGWIMSHGRHIRQSCGWRRLSPLLITFIDRHLIRGVGYSHLVGATRYGSLLLLDPPEDPLPLSEMIVLYPLNCQKPPFT